MVVYLVILVIFAILLSTALLYDDKQKNKM